MTESEVNQILVRLAVMDAKLDGISNENAKADALHLDHETRLRALEATRSEGNGVWKLLTAGGAIGGLIVGAAAIALRAVGA